MKNKMEDLRNHLFAQLERLGDENLTSDQIKEEVKRAEAIVNVGTVITEIAKVEVKFLQEFGMENKSSFFEQKQLK
jgi:hypothetical protein